MAFPTTSILENANRANEDPLGNGTWTSPSFGDGHGAKIVSNQIAPTATGFSGSLWNTTFTADQEVFWTLVTLANDTFGLLATRVTSPGASWTGYELQHPSATNKNTWTLFKNVVGVQSTLTTWTQAVAAGDSVGYSVIGTSITPYYKPAAGAWGALTPSFTDSSVTGAGQIGLEIDNLGAARAFDDWGGGAAITRVPRGNVNFQDPGLF